MEHAPQPHHREGIQEQLDIAYDEGNRDNIETAKSTGGEIDSTFKQKSAEIEAVRAEISAMAKPEEKFAHKKELSKTPKVQMFPDGYVSPKDFSVGKKLIYLFTKGYWPSRRSEDEYGDGGY